MLQQLLSIFLESTCLICDRSTDAQICPCCFGKISEQRRSDFKLPAPNQQLPLLAWGCYDGQLKRAIALMKYQHKPEIGQFLGKELGKRWLKLAGFPHPETIVMPIPLHPQRLAERGYNQAEVIAQEFCQVVGYELAKGALVRAKATQPMFSLSPAERELNLQEAFSVRVSRLRRPVLLIDDIYTSGATIRAACQALKQRKIMVKAVAVIALAGRIHDNIYLDS